MNINGDGNPKLIGFSSNKEIAIELSSAIFDNRAIALLTGNDIVEGAKEVYRREVITVVDSSGDKIAQLTNTPADGELLGLYLLGADGVESTEYKLSDDYPEETEYVLNTKTLLFHDDVEVGTKFVAYFIADTAATTQTITVSSDKFPAAFKLVMHVFVTDFHTKALYLAEIVIPSAKMEDNWTLSFRPDGEPEPLNLPIEVLQPAGSTDMLTMKIIDEDNIV